MSERRAESRRAVPPVRASMGEDGRVFVRETERGTEDSKGRWVDGRTPAIPSNEIDLR